MTNGERLHSQSQGQASRTQTIRTYDRFLQGEERLLRSIRTQSASMSPTPLAPCLQTVERIRISKSGRVAGDDRGTMSVQHLRGRLASIELLKIIWSHLWRARIWVSIHLHKELGTAHWYLVLAWRSRAKIL